MLQFGVPPVMCSKVRYPASKIPMNARIRIAAGIQDGNLFC